MFNHQDFIDKYYPGATDARKADAERFLNRAEEVIGDKAPEDVLRDKSAVCKLFYLQQLAFVTRTHYQKIKDYVINLFDWFGVSGEVPTQREVIDAGECIGYFRSLQSALDFIDSVGRYWLPDYHCSEDLITIKAIYVLGWYGLSLDEISSLKKDDIKATENGDGAITLSDRQVKIAGNILDILTSLKSLESYQSLPNGRTKYLHGDDKDLFRSTSSGETQIDASHLIQILKRFNAQVPSHMRQRIAFRSIRVNALFVEILNDTSEESLLNKILAITHCSPTQAYSYRTQYLAWVDMLDKNII